MSTDRRSGEAPIKAEFRKERWFDDEEDRNLSANNAVFGDEEAEGQKFSNEDDKKKNRGANKGQRGKKRIVDQIRICSHIARAEECPFGEKCRHSHDLETYLATRPADLGDKCIQFDLFGKCRHGYKCRFLKAHLDENNKLVVNEELVKKNPKYTRNGLSPDVQRALNKRKFDFPKYNSVFVPFVKAKAEADNKRKREEQTEVASKRVALEGENGEAVKSDESNDTAGQEKASEDAEQPAPAEVKQKIEDKTVQHTAEEFKLGAIDTEKPFKKTIDFRDKTYLAPLTTVGNLPFRRICKEYGVDITCGEMALVKNLLQGQQSEWALTKRHVSEDIFGIQICGSKPEMVAQACELINQEVDVDFVDLNMGCPIDLVCNTGSGSALPEQKTKMARVLQGMRLMMDTPVTVKFRTGYKEGVFTTHKLMPIFENLNISLATLHGRSRQQRYTRLANWDFIQQLKSQSKTIPIYGNGDVLSFEDYNRHKAERGVDGIMVGRGALIKPWLFDEIKQQRHWDISSRERFDMMRRFCDYGLEHWGTDSQGVNTTRRFLCEWQSFLYRYIPVGLLEVLPQRINDRAPPFTGRDDLETLMASPRSADWVKLSEMFLGPAPEDFKFVPKHKSNSFEG